MWCVEANKSQLFTSIEILIDHLELMRRAFESTYLSQNILVISKIFDSVSAIRSVVRNIPNDVHFAMS